MPSSIYYPNRVCSSRDIAKMSCPSDLSPEDFERRLLAANGRPISTSNLCAPHKPLLLPNARRDDSVDISQVLSCTPEQQHTLSHLSHYAGGAAVMGMADFLWDTRLPDVMGDLNTFGGNGMGAAVAQSNRVLDAINRYDIANKRFEDLKNHRAAPRMVNAAKLRADAAFREMNQVLYCRSLNYLNSTGFRMRQTTNGTGRPVWESIPVRDTADVQKLARFAKVGRVAGPGFILLDGYLRANSVHHAWKNGDPAWKREAVVQSGAFAGGIAAGAAIGFVIALTPVGLAVAVVAAGAVAVGSDYLLKGIFGDLYDLVTEW